MPDVMVKLFLLLTLSGLAFLPAGALLRAARE
jgi:hypothetical protein